MPLLKPRTTVTEQQTLEQRYARLGPHGLEQYGQHLEGMAFADIRVRHPYIPSEHPQAMPKWAYHLLPEEDGS